MSAKWEGWENAEDPLRSARGIVHGCVISLAFMVGIFIGCVVAIALFS